MTGPPAEVRSASAPAAVWGVLTAVAQWRSWNPGIAWVVLEGPLAAGTYVTVKPSRGRQTALRILAAAAPEQLVLGVSAGPLARLRLAYAIAPDGAGSRIRAEVATGGPFPRLVRAGAAWIAAALPAHLERLARAAEGSLG